MSPLRLPASNQESKAGYPSDHGRRQCCDRDVPCYEWCRDARWICYLLWIIHGFIWGGGNCRHAVENHYKLNNARVSRSIGDIGYIRWVSSYARVSSLGPFESTCRNRESACRVELKARESRLVLKAPS